MSVRKRSLASIWGVLLIVFGMPVFLWFVGIWWPSREGCVYPPMRGLLATHAGFSVVWEGEHHSPHNPLPKPWNGKGHAGSAIALPSRAYDESASIGAWHQVSYVNCTLDEAWRSDQAWLAEYRSARIGELIEHADDPAAAWPDGRRVALRLDDPTDPSAGERKQIAERELQRFARAFPGWFTEWFPARLLEAPRIVGWLDGAVLLRGELPDQYFLIGRHHGFMAELDPEQRCARGAMDLSQCGARAP